MTHAVRIASLALTAALLAAIVPASFGLLPGCGAVVCPTGWADAIGEHIANKVPLDSQSDCAGASRIPFNTPQSVTHPDHDAGSLSCTVSENADACVLCLVEQCCVTVLDACATLSTQAACWGVPKVLMCYEGAQAACAPFCPSTDGGADPDAGIVDGGGS